MSGGQVRIAALALALGAQIASAQLQGVIDLHVHSDPDSFARSINAIEVARLAKRHQLRALLLKNHFNETATTAYLVRQVVPGIELYGGIALNRSVGGVNPAAVEKMAAMAGSFGRVVWMPTFDAENHRTVMKLGPPFVAVSSSGKLLPEVEQVLQVMAREDLALATGHSSPEESLLLIRAAKNAGIDRIVVTHPMNHFVRMPVETQREAAQLGAFLEYPYNLILPSEGSISFEDVAKAIRSVGPEHVVITSDLGQAANPVHTAGLLDFFERLRQEGFREPEIDRMARVNPARFLGLD